MKSLLSHTEVCWASRLTATNPIRKLLDRTWRRKNLTGWCSKVTQSNIVANKIIEQEVLESKKREHEDSFAEATLFLRIAVFLTTVGTLFMSVIVYGKFGPELESVMQYVGIGLICAAALAAIIVVVFIHRAKFVPSNF